ncbi:hypothetical protein [Pontivivens nitratireducens]|uniref:hypothetical protein n=1 Tax=Pontivivens nitratireducens TaxID=2758038 RepID=UPI00163B1B9F|nr:hypothetical protein [Pontibrevibacter nitratireducens]
MNKIFALPILLLAACTAPGDEATFDRGPLLSEAQPTLAEDTTITVTASARNGILTGERCHAMVSGERVFFSTPGELTAPDGVITDLRCTARGTTLVHDGPVAGTTSQVAFVFN